MNFAVVIILASLLIGLSKGGLGGALPVALTTPLLSQVLPVPRAVGLALPLLLIGDAFALRIYWREWDSRIIRLMLPMAIVGIVVGTLLLANLPDEVLRPLLGLFTLTVVLYKLASDRLRQLTYEPHTWHGYFVGVVAGLGSALANTGGPPFTAYLLLQKVSPQTFIGTTTLFFAIINLLKLPIQLQAGVVDLSLFFSVLWVVPLIPVGVWIGRRLVDWMNPRFFETVVIGVLLAASLALILVPPA